MKCGLIGGIVLFLWSAISWTIFPWQKAQMGSFADEKEVQSTIMDNVKGSGLYVLPNLNAYANKSNEMADAKARMSTGPFVVAAVSVEGRNPNMAGSLLASLIVKIVAACLVTWLLLQVPNRNYNQSVKFVTVAGVAIALLAALPNAIWFGFPGPFVMGSIFEMIVGWFFAGLAIAKCAKYK